MEMIGAGLMTHPDDDPMDVAIAISRELGCEVTLMPQPDHKMAYGFWHMHAATDAHDEAGPFYAIPMAMLVQPTDGEPGLLSLYGRMDFVLALLLRASLPRELYNQLQDCLKDHFGDLRVGDGEELEIDTAEGLSVIQGFLLDHAEEIAETQTAMDAAAQVSRLLNTARDRQTARRPEDN